MLALLSLFKFLLEPPFSIETKSRANASDICASVDPWRLIILKGYTTKSTARNSPKPFDVSWAYTHCKADASEIGLGGYSLDGCAWWWKIPTELQSRASINLLEILAPLVGLWIDQLEGNHPQLSCCLCESDSSLAAIWLCQTNLMNQNNQLTLKQHRKWIILWCMLELVSILNGSLDQQTPLMIA